MSGIATIYPVDGPWKGQLAIVARPRGGDWLPDEVHSWRQAGLNTIVSLLTEDEVKDLNLEQEGDYCRKDDVQFIEFAIRDRSVPASRAATSHLIEQLDRALTSGRNIGVHCRQGIGRSALVAACLLVMSGLEATTAFQRISTARGLVVPETSEQRDWVVQYARELVPSATSL